MAVVPLILFKNHWKANKKIVIQPGDVRKNSLTVSPYVFLLFHLLTSCFSFIFLHLASLSSSYILLLLHLITYYFFFIFLHLPFSSSSYIFLLIFYLLAIVVSLSRQSNTSSHNCHRKQFTTNKTTTELSQYWELSTFSCDSFQIFFSYSKTRQRGVDVNNFDRFLRTFTDKTVEQKRSRSLCRTRWRCAKMSFEDRNLRFLRNPSMLQLNEWFDNHVVFFTTSTTTNLWFMRLETYFNVGRVNMQREFHVTTGFSARTARIWLSWAGGATRARKLRRNFSVTFSLGSEARESRRPAREVIAKSLERRPLPDI